MVAKTPLLIFRILLFTGTAVSLYFVPWPIVTAWLKPVPDSIEQQVEKIDSYGFDGIIVYVEKKGQAARWYTAGYDNKVEKTAVDPHALFKIASIDKLYTALSITKLASRGKLSLDKTLVDYFPELEGRIEYADEISIRMLVQHRSGIPNLTDVPDFYNNPPANSEEALALILDQPADFKPDAKYKYCNTNYLLLGSLIEELSDSSKFHFIKENILDPLDLKNTYASIHDINMDDLMSGYYVGIEEDMKTVDYGSMIASAEDVGIFLRALNEGTIFDDGEMEIYSSIYEFNHTGLMPGYQSIARYHKDIDAVVVQFTNTTKFDGYNWNLSTIMYRKIMKLLRKEENTLAMLP